MWHKINSRRIGVQVAQQWSAGFLPERKPYRISIQDTLAYFDGKKTEYYADAAQWTAYEKGLFDLLKDRPRRASLISDAQRFLEITSGEIRQLLSTNVSALSDAQLASFYSNVIEKVNAFYSRMWIVFLISDPLAQTVHGELLKRVPDEKKAGELLLDFSTPLEPNDAIQERMDLLELAMSRNELPEKELENRLQRHTRAYQHIPMFDFNHEPYSVMHFRKELERVSAPEEERARLKHVFSDRQQVFDRQLRGLQLQPDHDLFRLLQMLKETVFVRDYRDMLRQKMNLSLRTLYSEIGKRLQLSIEQVSLLTNQDIETGLIQSEKRSRLRKSAEERLTAFLLVQRIDSARIFGGNDAIRKSSVEIKEPDIANVTELVGVVGSRGKVFGKACIVHSNRDLAKVKDGEIMFTSMTRQDFVSVIRRCNALVTDEGGVTCHAAIICRELNVPCVVGTRFGTRVFKDGDVVEVDAEQGVVRKVNP
ncbi:hypothetical protein KJ765_01405 [Candidatus Micrarchaeota archaeon]|nr:hypothetical protein [Candidatus Micrarchaeota archaeon]